MNHKKYFLMIERQLSRLIEIDKGVEENDHEKLKDEFIKYFIIAYHLKDYIKVDPDFTNVAKKTDVEAFISRTPELSICADMCNGLKHCVLSVPRSRTGSQPTVKGGEAHYLMEAKVENRPGIYPAKMTIKYKMKIDHGGTEYDGLELAKLVFDLWKSYIQ
jgi:hypothetical protein